MWDRTRAVAERAVRDPKTRESAADLIDRLRELAIEDQRRGAGRTIAIIAVVGGALAIVAGILWRRSDTRY